jgi:hypothetical protein
VNRALGHDFPGTLALRRSTFMEMEGYDGDVLFENLELIRTVRAHGGRVVVAYDAIIPRRAPSLRTFLEQRVRQAYDDLAQPPRLIASLAILPLVGTALARRSWPALLGGAAAAIATAELGRRRRGPAEAFPATSALLAPCWIMERGVTSWLAVAARLLFGGIRYRGTLIRRAATPGRELRRRASARRTRQPEGLAAAGSRGAA